MTVQSSDSVVRQSVFEGLFVHVLKVSPDSKVADALRKVGYDLRRQLPEYPSWVWKDAVAVACQHRHPGVAPEEAMRLLGRAFIEGFLATVAGRALGVVLPMIGTEAAIKRLERFMSMGVPQLRATATAKGPRYWQVEVRARWALPDFDAGLIEAGLRRAGSPLVATVVERGSDRYVVDLRW